MSIIIRLQNLPWSANAMDIRQFFNGLQIPEGGVHIVGGELGDAFIAFSTDEDARQAFLRTDGKIKGIQIKLMLSSRTEMQRVIEQARNQSMAAFMLPATPAVQPVQTAAPLPAAVPPVLPAAIPELQKESKERDDSHSERKRDRRRSRSKSRDKRDRSRDRRDRRHRDRSRSKSRDRRDRRRGRDRSRSRNRSRDKESRGRRDRAKTDDKREDKDVVIPFQKDTKKPVPEIWNSRPQNPQPTLNIIPPASVTNEGPNLLRPWGLEPSVKTNFVANMAANLQTRNLNGFQPNPAREGGFGMNSLNPTPSRPRESWPPANPPSVRESFRSPRDYPPSPIISNNNRGPRGDLRGPLEDVRGGPRGEPNISKDFRGPRNLMEENIRSPRDEFRELRAPREDKNDLREDTRPIREDLQGPRKDLRTELNARRAIIKETHPKRSRFEDIDSPVNACIALDPFYGSYGDLRRFFYGLSINYKGIKVINDEYGHKTGVCFVQFRDASNKNEAIKMNGRNLNNTSIKIKHISDQVFEEAIDRYNPRMDEMNPCEDHLSRTRNTKKFLSNEPEIKDFVCLKLEDLPTFVKEQDILHIFSQHPLISLHLNFKPKGGTVAYVKFSSKEVAKQAFDERSHHVIRGKPVTVKPCTTEEFNQVNSQQVQAFEEPKPKPIDIGVIPTKIHLMSNNLGFTGQAYCEFESGEEALRGSAKDNIVLGQNTITVRPILRADMEKILGNTLPHPGTALGQALAPGTPLPPIKQAEVISSVKQETVVAPPVANKPAADDKVDSPPKRELQTPAAQPQAIVLSDEASPKDDGNDEHEKEDLEAPNLDLAESPPLSLQGRPPLTRDRDGFNGRHMDEFHEFIEFDSPDMDDSHLSFERPRGKFEGPGSRFDGPRGNNFAPKGGHADFGPPRGGHRGSRFGPRGGSRFNQHRNDSPVEDEVPGCTVFMDNVPYKAGTNEILDFFEGHNCTNNVSRRYNPNNTPSAEAKVTFYSPDDAYRAVRELHGKKIWGRVIFLRQH